MAIPFIDIGYYPREKIGVLKWFGYEGVRQCIVPWAQRRAFMVNMLYTAWPSAYDGVNAYCIQAEQEPFPESAVGDAGNGYVSYEFALVTLHYTTNVFSPRSGVIGWERIRGQAHTHPIRIPSGALHWNASDGTAVKDGDSPAYFDDPGMIYERGYAGVSSIPAAVFTSWKGINANDITAETLGVTFAAQTLKFNEYSADRQVTVSGGQAWKLVYEHFWLPHVNAAGTALGHNSFWNAEANDYQRVYLSDGTQYTPNRLVNMPLIYP